MATNEDLRTFDSRQIRILEYAVLNWKEYVAQKIEARQRLSRTMILLWRSRVAKRQMILLRTPNKGNRSKNCHSVHGAKFYTPQKLEIFRKLGEGSFAEVFLAQVKTSQETLVVKVFKTEIPDIKSSEQEAFLHEMEFQRELFHPNILEFKGVFWHNARLNMVAEYIPGGTMLDYITSSADVPVARRLQMAYDIASAMNFLHGQSIIHRDLKSSNCLLRENLSVVVIDFGLSRRLLSEHAGHVQRSVADRYAHVLERLSSFEATSPEDPSPPVQVRLHRRTASKLDSGAFRQLQRTTPMSRPHEYSKQIGTAFYMAPELYLDREYNEAVDVFSFGIVCAELVARVFADPDVMPRTIIFEDGKMAFGLDEVAFRKQYDCVGLESLLQIAVCCCDFDGSNRPGFAHTREVLRILLKRLGQEICEEEQSQ